MKIEIDFKQKTIVFQEEVSLLEAYETLVGYFGEEIKEYKIKSFIQYLDTPSRTHYTRERPLDWTYTTGGTNVFLGDINDCVNVNEILNSASKF